MITCDAFRKRGKHWALAAMLPIVSLLAIPQAKSEPAALAGTWIGGGVVAYPSGTRERARCQASYSGGASVSVSATCATPSGNVSQFARLRKTGANSYSGTFFNAQYNMTGTIHVTVHGNTQTVSITSGSGSASLKLKR